jgi:hypothetical protein
VEPVVYLQLAAPQLNMQAVVVVLDTIKRPVMELVAVAVAVEPTFLPPMPLPTLVAEAVVLAETGSTIPMAATVALE